MFFIRLIVWGFACVQINSADAQSTPQKVLNIFDDLPVNDASERSVLKSGETAAQKMEKNIFIKTLLSKQECYAGEPVLLQYKLYTAVQSRSELSKLPVFNHFAAYAITNVQEQPEYEQLGNHKFRVYNIAAWQLFPYTTGVLHIDPLSVQNHVSYEDGMGAAVAYSGVTQSDALTIQVLEFPQPENGKSFSGAIGNFTIAANYQNDTLVAGEVNHLHLTITGTGNFNSVTLPEITWPAGTQVFAAKESTQVDFEKFPASGTKYFDIPFVITRAGDYAIPAWSFTYFNADAKKYQSFNIATKSIHIKSPASKLIPDLSKTLNNNKDWWVVLTVSAFLLLFVVCMLRYAQQKARKSKAIVVAEPSIEYTNPASRFEGLFQLDAVEDNSRYITQLKGYLTENFIHDHSSAGRIFKNSARELVSNCDYLLFSPDTITTADRQQVSNAVKEFCNSYKELINEPSSLLN